jgi:hypothetical protein
VYGQLNVRRELSTADLLNAEEPPVAMNDPVPVPKAESALDAVPAEAHDATAAVRLRGRSLRGGRNDERHYDPWSRSEAPCWARRARS